MQKGVGGAAADVNHVHAQSAQGVQAQAMRHAADSVVQAAHEVGARTGSVIPLRTQLIRARVQRDRVARGKAQSGMAHGQRICAANVQKGVGGAAADVNHVHAQGTQGAQAQAAHAACGADCAASYSHRYIVIIAVKGVGVVKRLRGSERNYCRLRSTSDSDGGRLGHRAAIAVADGVADRDGLGLARCQSVKGCVGGVYREHACAAQAQPSRHRAGGVCRTYLVGHATQAQRVAAVYVDCALEQVQSDAVAAFRRRLRQDCRANGGRVVGTRDGNRHYLLDTTCCLNRERVRVLFPST